LPYPEKARVEIPFHGTSFGAQSSGIDAPGLSAVARSGLVLHWPPAVGQQNGN
jgi:hypothetical protein